MSEFLLISSKSDRAEPPRDKFKLYEKQYCCPNCGSLYIEPKEPILCEYIPRGSSYFDIVAPSATVFSRELNKVLGNTFLNQLKSFSINYKENLDEFFGIFSLDYTIPIYGIGDSHFFTTCRLCKNPESSIPKLAKRYGILKSDAPQPGNLNFSRFGDLIMHSEIYEKIKYEIGNKVWVRKLAMLDKAPIHPSVEP